MSNLDRFEVNNNSVHNLIDPIDIAFLRGGWSASLHATVFGLWVQKLIIIQGEGKNAQVSIVQTPSRPLEPIEKAIHDFLQIPQTPHILLHDPYIQKKIKSILITTRRKLEKMILIRTATGMFRLWMTAFAMAIIIIFAGGLKLYIGNPSNTSLGLLPAMLILSPFFLFYIMKPWLITTRSGRRYLKELSDEYDWLKESVYQGNVPGEIDPAFPMALYGVEIFYVADIYDPFVKAFPLKQSLPFQPLLPG